MRDISEGKWNKHIIMMENENLRPHLPDTAMFTKETLWSFIKKYKEIILKPSSGRRGKNILKVTSLGDEKYEIHLEDKKEVCNGRAQTSAYLNQYIGSRPYIIQRYVKLARINDSPFDIRVITQRRESNEWIVTAKVAKVAGEGYIVTNNELSGGMVLPVQPALSQSDSNRIVRNVVEEIEYVTLQATEILASYYKKQAIFGFDIGIDTHGHVWIIEGNLRPSMSHFYKLQDKTMFWRIKRFHSSNE